MLLVFTISVHRAETRQQVLNDDRVLLTHLGYGLFNVDQWKGILADIVTKKVEGFEVTDSNREEVLAKTEEVLAAVIDEVELLMRERNMQSLGGVLKQFATDLLFDFDEVRADIPRYAVVIVERLDDADTKAALKDWLIAKINTFADETVGEMDYGPMNEVMQRYACRSKDECLEVIAAYRQDARADSRLGVYGLAIAVALLLLFMLVFRYDRGTFIAFCLSAMVLLAAGISLPMIDIEASITRFAFTLLGEEVVFEDQVVFHQSKSIVEVVQLLVVNGDLPLIAVAVLIAGFSIVLPLAKLIISLWSAVQGRLPGGRVAHFLLFRSGKWSMADVMVVALFMAYIGFSGVINSQLSQLESSEGSLEVFTTNNSTLRLGFYLFTAYALSGLLLSERLTRFMETSSKLKRT